MRLGKGCLYGRSSRVQWATMAALSMLLIAVSEFVRLPAATLIGPLLAAIFIAVSEGNIRLPTAPFIVAQGLIGCMIGAGISLTTLAAFGKSWPLFAFGIVSVIIAAGIIGYVLTKADFLPGTTAIWGVSPGASTPMILMSEAYGADPRLVAVMQMLRVACVIGLAAIVARIWAPGVVATTASPATSAEWWPAIRPLPLLITFLLASVSAMLAVHLKIPAGPILVPLVLTVVLGNSQIISVELPHWLLALSYACIGWSIGLRFTRPILAHALGALPRIFAAIFALIAISGAIAAALVLVADIDPLTAYLATSPGGADSIAIIAASTNVDIQFVMTMQTARLVIALLVSPAISRFVAKRAVRKKSPTD